MDREKQYNKKFNLHLRPSRYFFTLISGLHLIILLIACVSGIPWWGVCILLVIIVISYISLISKYIYRKSKNSVIQLWQHPDILNPLVWQLKFSNNKIKDAELKSKGYISNYLIIMHFKVLTDNKFLLKLSHFKILSKLKFKNIPVIIFPDMLDYSDYISLKRFLYGY